MRRRRRARAAPRARCSCSPSSPTYNPNLVEEQLRRDRAHPAPTAARRAARQPRDATGLFPPGSTFKVVTAAAALDTGRSRRTRVLRPRLLRSSTASRSRTRATRRPGDVRPLTSPGRSSTRSTRSSATSASGSAPDDPRLREALRLLLAPAARDARERAHRERPLQQRQALRPAAPTPRSTRAGSPSARSG